MISPTYHRTHFQSTFVLRARRFTTLATCLAALLATTGASAQYANDAEKQQFVQNTAALLASEQLCGYQVDTEILGKTFAVYGLEPKDLEPGGRYHDQMQRSKKHIAAATQDQAGKDAYCSNIKAKLGSLLN